MYDIEMFIAAFEDYHVLRANEKRSKFSFDVTKIFKSWGEEPQFLLMSGKRITNVEVNNYNISYDTSTESWRIQLNRNVARSYPYLQVQPNTFTSFQECYIATATMFLPQPTFAGVGGLGQLTEMQYQVKTNLQGKIFQHRCVPHRIILGWKDKLLFTVEGWDNQLLLSVDQLSNVEKIMLYAQTVGSSGTGSMVSIVDVAMSPTTAYLVLDNGILVSANISENLHFQPIYPGSEKNEKILGVSTTDMCLFASVLSDFVTYENSYAIVWTDSYLYFFSPKSEEWTLLEVPQDIHSGSDWSIEFARFSNLPGYLHFIMKKLGSGERILSKCQFLARNQELLQAMSCDTKQLTGFSTSSEVQVEVLNMIGSPSIIWNEEQILYINRGGDVIRFDGLTNLKNVIVNKDYNIYMVQLANNTMYYNRGGKLRRLREVDEVHAANFAYMFHPWTNDMYRLVVNDPLQVEVQVYPLSLELYSLNYKNEKHRAACDLVTYESNIFALQSGNVATIDNIDDTFVIEFSVVHPVEIDASVEVRLDSAHLVEMDFAQVAIKTAYGPDGNLHVFQSYEARLSGKCRAANSSEKHHGLSLFEIQLRDNKNAAACILPTSQTLLINVTCPAGRHVRVRDKSNNEQFCDSDDRYNRKPDENSTISGCLLELPLHKVFEPVLEVRNFDQLLYTLHNDLSFVEVNGRNDFSLNNENLLKKTCVHCANFTKPVNNSQVVLQLGKRACPCGHFDEAKVLEGRRDIYIGGISFKDVSVSDGQDAIFTFEIDDLVGNSCCDMRMRFNLRVPKEVSLVFLWYEYVILLTVLPISSISMFVVSYCRYITYVNKMKSLETDH